ncbi:MAG TPA: ribonuclease D [Acidobacteriota bacterium]|nr:ribonuclease D [Acidobacteriota bacterium]
MTDSLYIRDDRSLEQLVERIQGVSPLAIDTEFIRERTYYPRLCLIQLAAPGLLAVVDPLAVDDLGPLWSVLTAGPELVLHAAGQDLEIVQRLAGRLPSSHFDTQVAAAFLGYGDSIGHSKLVERLARVTLKRSEAYTDWTRRPLSDDQVQYALDDVRYLLGCAETMRAQLAERGRQHWVEEELSRVMRGVNASPDPDEMWRRVSGARSLTRRGAVILGRAAAWRERKAVSRDIPRQRVVADRVLIEIARRAPKKQGQVERLRGLHPREAQRSASTILAFVREALESDPATWPDVSTPRPRGGMRTVEILASLLDAVVRTRAAELDLAPRLLAKRADLERLVRQEIAGDAEDHGIPVLQGWRREHVGDQLLALLRGDASVRVQQTDDGPRLRLGS